MFTIQDFLNKKGFIIFFLILCLICFLLILFQITAHFAFGVPVPFYSVLNTAITAPIIILGFVTNLIKYKRLKSKEDNIGK